MSQTNAKRQMPSRLVRIDEKRFRGFGCSECAWVFGDSRSKAGASAIPPIKIKIPALCLRRTQTQGRGTL
jgi:hypothetical protein